MLQLLGSFFDKIGGKASLRVLLPYLISCLKDIYLSYALWKAQE